MKQVDYFKIIHKYIPPDSRTYAPYITHAVLVASKAATAAHRIGLSEKQIQFIKEAAMLHDIGIFKIKDPDLFCVGDKRYEKHLTEGRKILEKERLPEHALVCQRHTSIIGAEKIAKCGLPADELYVPQTIEEEIIAWTDKFYSKTGPHLFIERTVEQILAQYKKFGKGATELFKKWNKKFAE